MTNGLIILPLGPLKMWGGGDEMSKHQADFMAAAFLALAVLLGFPQKADANTKETLEPANSAVQAATPWRDDNRVALVIGVNRYVGDASLSKSEADAKGIAQTLSQLGFSTTNLRVLDNSPTKGEVYVAIDYLTKQIDRTGNYNTTVVVYFSGHGVREYDTNFLLMRDADVSAQANRGLYQDSGVKTADIIKLFSENGHVRRIIFVLDACRTTAYNKANVNLLVDGAEEKVDVTYFFAVQDGAAAWEGKPGTHSVFTQSLINKLNSQTSAGSALSVLADEIRKDYETLQMSVNIGPRQRVQPATPFVQGPDKNSYVLRRPNSQPEIKPRPLSTVGDNSAPTATAMPTSASFGPIRASRVRPYDLKAIPRPPANRPPNCNTPVVSSAVWNNPTADGVKFSRQAIESHGTTCLEYLAASGDTQAHFVLGMAYMEGFEPEAGSNITVEKLPTAAMYHLREATISGEPRAANAVGFYFCCTDLTDRNESEAVGWFDVASRRGSLNAKANIGYNMAYGIGTPKDIEGGIRILKDAAAQGSGRAYTLLGDIYSSSAHDRMDLEVARNYYEDGFKAGYPDAASKLGSLYEYGFAADDRYIKAYDWYTRGGEAGCKDCWFRAAGMVRAGKRGVADATLERDLLRRGSDAGDVDAGLGYALDLKNGSGKAGEKSAVTEEDLKKAFATFERMARRGSAEARGYVGLALIEGEGTIKDTKRGATILREILSNDRSNDPDIRYSVYEPNYWHFGTQLAKFIEAGEVAPITPNEAAELYNRYGEKGSRRKRFTVPVDCGLGNKTPFDIYIVNWNRPDDETIEGQVGWLKHMRNCSFPPDVVDSFRKIKIIARENNVSFVDLMEYALSAAKTEATNPAKANDGKKF